MKMFNGSNNSFALQKYVFFQGVNLYYTFDSDLLCDGSNVDALQNINRLTN